MNELERIFAALPPRLDAALESLLRRIHKALSAAAIEPITDPVCVHWGAAKSRLMR